MDRESAWALVEEYAHSERLIRHCTAVEATLRA